MDGCEARKMVVPCKPCRDRSDWCALSLPCEGEEEPTRKRVVGRMATVSREEEACFKFVKELKEACVASGDEGLNTYGKMAQWVHVS